MHSRRRSEGFLTKPAPQPKYIFNLPFRVSQLQVQLKDQQNEERHLSPPKEPMIPSTDLNLLKEPGISVYISLRKASERCLSNSQNRPNHSGSSDPLSVSEFCKVLKTMHRRRESATNYASIETSIPPVINEESIEEERPHKRSLSLPTISKAKRLSCDSSDQDTSKSTVETIALRSSYLRPAKSKPIRLVKEILGSNSRRVANYPLARVLSSKDAIESVYNFLDSQPTKLKGEKAGFTGENMKALNMSRVTSGGLLDDSTMCSSRVSSNRAGYYKNKDVARTNNIYQMKALAKDMSFSQLKMEILAQKKIHVKEAGFVNSLVPVLSARK